MGTLEKVQQMKGEGLSEGDIITKLKAEGVSPMEINDSINQSKIKEAVGNSSPTEGMMQSAMPNAEEEQQLQTPQPGAIPAPGQDPAAAQAQDPNSYYTPAQGDQGQPAAPPAQDLYMPQEPAYPQDSYGGGPQPPTQFSPSPYPEDQGYYDEGYGDEAGYQDYSSSSDTMIEISEQVFAEKIKKVEETLTDLAEFKTVYQTRIDDMNERLKRMEKYFDKMQMTIIDKVGNFGKELNSLQKEMNMVEDSFSKMNKRI